MKTYEINQENYDTVYEEILADLSTLLVGQELVSTKYGKGTIEQVMHISAPVARAGEDGFAVQVLLNCENGNPMFILNIGLRIKALVLNDENVYNEFKEFYPVCKDLLNIKIEKAKEIARIEAEKECLEREARKAEEERKKAELKILARQKKIIDKLQETAIKNSISKHSDFYSDLGWIAKHVGTIRAEVPDFAARWFETHFGFTAVKTVVDSKKKTSGGFSMKWNPSFSISFKDTKDMPITLQQKCNGKKSINDTAFVFDLVDNYGFKFGKEQNLDEIISSVPSDKIDSFRLGLTA